MAQHDYIIANQSGAAFRADLNNGLAAIVSQNSGTNQPSTTYAHQWWADTTTGLLKIRNAANNAWITIGTLADANLGLLSLAGGALTGNLTLNAQSDLRLADSDSSNWVALQAPATVATNVTFTAPSADGTADQSLVTNGSGTLSFANRSRFVRATEQATTSGTEIDFTSIPSWVRRITVTLVLVSTSGISMPIIQLGDSGGIETTGYVSIGAAVSVGTPNATNGGSSTAGIRLGQAAHTANSEISGNIEIVNPYGNYWIATGLLMTLADDSATMTITRKELSATLDRLRLTTTGGTNTFDGGTVNIIYEG